MFRTNLINKIPKVKGDLITNAILAKSSWFRVGGPAEVLFVPRDETDLVKFIKELDLASLSSGKSININLIKKIINK